MNDDGTLTSREIEKAVPQPDTSMQYKTAERFDPNTPIAIGDFLRLVAYAQPGWLDRWNDTPTDNAQEHTDEVVQLCAQHGITVLVHQVNGVEVSDETLDHREAWVYDLEVVGFTDPPENKEQLAAVDIRGLALLAAAIAALIGVGTAAFLIVKAETIGPGKGARMVSNGIFWISLAAIAVATAVIVKSARSAAP